MNLNLTSSQAAAVRSALIALNFEPGHMQIDFDPIDVFVKEFDLITVRGGPHGYEEHKGLRAFESAYGLHDSAPELLALAYEMESMCEAFLLYAAEEGKDLEQRTWSKRRERCRAAITASMAKSSTSPKSEA